MDIPANNANHIYYLGRVTDAGGNVMKGWVHHNDADMRPILAEGSVIMWKTAQNGQGARDFMNIVVVSESEATAIGGVTEYISAKNGDAIYNL